MREREREKGPRFCMKLKQTNKNKLTSIGFSKYRVRRLKNDVRFHFSKTSFFNFDF
jgi:hypothetical protein